jgi:hypothetical protein
MAIEESRSDNEDRNDDTEAAREAADDPVDILLYWLCI